MDLTEILDAFEASLTADEQSAPGPLVGRDVAARLASTAEAFRVAALAALDAGEEGAHEHFTAVMDVLHQFESPRLVTTVEPPVDPDEPIVSLQSTAAVDPAQNATFFAGHRRNIERLRELL